jgi:alkyl hydroperoxide reductase subunit AhpC
MQAVRANPGMAAPAGWNPGDELIKTGKEQIGKY